MTRVMLMDKVALAATLILCLLGVVFVRSATAYRPDSVIWIKQLIWVGAGLVMYLMISQYDYKALVDKASLWYLLGIAALIGVLVWGHEVHGAKSWFRLPFMSVQPSEFVKIATVLMVTKYFSKLNERPSSLVEFMGSSILIGLPFTLIIMQPDLGTALVFMPFFLLPNFLLGNRESIWVTGLGVALVTLIVLGVNLKPDWVFFLKDYQKERIVSFLDPEADTANSGYQVHQSKISIGQGGLFGMGIFEGKQTRLGFLPEQHNDFILAVVAEETGFLGVLGVLALFMLLFMRGFMTALEACDATGSILATLATGVLVAQMLFNAAMLVGLVPTTGIPCPLLSYGGSSALTSLILLGLIQSVRAHRFVNH